MPIAKITSKGQVTLPKPIRERLRLKTGDRVDFIEGDDGAVRLVPHNVRVEALREILPPARRRLSDAALDKAIQEGWGRRARRS